MNFDELFFRGMDELFHFALFQILA